MTKSKKRLLKRTEAEVSAPGAQTMPPRTASGATPIAMPMKPAQRQQAQLEAESARGMRPDGPTVLSADERRAMIEQAAYFRAERRGFTPGHEGEDWIAAEREVDQFLAASPAPGARTRSRRVG